MSNPVLRRTLQLTLSGGIAVMPLGLVLISIPPGQAQTPFPPEMGTAADLLPITAPPVQIPPALPPSGASQPMPLPTTVAPPMPNPPSLPQADDSYTLGPGDKIQISIFNVPELSGEARVAIDGTVSLPWIGNMPLYQLTIAQTQQLLTQQYKRFLTRPPVINVVLMEMRPVRVTVSGQVNRPGTYEPLAVGDVSRPGTYAPDNLQAGYRPNRPIPTLTQALQNAGGITPQANIRRILVRRPQRGGNRVAQIDLTRLINQGDAAQDIALRDGDSIVVPMADEIDTAEAIRMGSASFAPRNIRVQVVGEVVRSGPVEVANGASLNQAILAAGGFNQERALKSEVEFVRLNQDGSVMRRNIPVDLAAAPNDTNNPLMRENDVIVVQRSRTTTVKDNVGGFLTPLTGVVSILRLLFDR